MAAVASRGRPRECTDTDRKHNCGSPCRLAPAVGVHVVRRLRSGRRQRRAQTRFLQGASQRRKAMNNAVESKWISEWDPEDETFWASRGKKIARRNLIWSIVAENIGFSIWLI